MAALALAVAALVGAGLAVAHGGARTRSGYPRARIAASKMCGVRTIAGTYKHVIVLFMENNSYKTIYKSAYMPYVNSVISACGLATNYHNVSHPSLPNYLAATDGGTVAEVTTPFVTDCTPSVACESSNDNIFHQLNVKHKVWKGYAESMPSNCGKSGSGQYAPRHNPAVYYTDLSNCAANDVPLGTTSNSPLLKNFSSDTSAPAFAWITPNLCSDQHGNAGCPTGNALLTTGDNFLKLWLPKITATGAYKAGHTAIFIAWDEGEPGSSGENCAAMSSDESCHVVAFVVAPSVKPGTRSGTLFSHWSLLKTSEDLLGLAELDQAKTAKSMAHAFNL
jgi:hypothetical protein